MSDPNGASAIKINEIFYSIQGESSQAGLPCVFVRLTYCNLRCNYCDTEYAFFEGREMSLDEIIREVQSYNCRLVEITGGEPLVQKNVHKLMKSLCDSGYQVMLETGGHMDISMVDRRVKIIMDIKCPGSSESGKNLWPNLKHLKKDDEIKFVISDRADFDWAVKIVNENKLTDKHTVLVSGVQGKTDYKNLAEWIMKSALPLKLQYQLHKLIWPQQNRGV